MIRHQAETVDANLVTARENVEFVQVEDGVNRVEEGVLAAGSALVDVVDLAALPVAEARWIGLFMHTDKCVFAAKILIYFRYFPARNVNSPLTY